MAFYLAGLNSYVLFGLIFGSISIISIITLLAAHKYFNSIIESLQGERFLVPFFTINGAILGFLLTMVIVQGYKDYQIEKENITIEMSLYINMYRIADGLEYSDGIKTKNYVKELVKETIDISWSELEIGSTESQTSPLINNFHRYLLKLNSKNNQELDLRKDLLDNLNRTTELRRLRLLKGSQEVVPEPMWIVIFCCIFISIFSSFIFTIKPFSIHINLIFFQCTMISFVLFLMISFMYPYRGPVKISPQPFELLLNVIFPKIDNLEKL